MSDVSRSLESEPEDFQKKMDAKVSLILEKMRSYDPLVDQVKDLKSAVDLLFSLLKDLSDKHVEIKAALLQRIDDMKKDQCDAHSMAQSMAQKMIVSDSSLKGLKEEVDFHRENVAGTLGRLSLSHESLQRQMLSKDQFISYAQGVDRSVACMQHDLLSLHTDIESLKLSVAQHLSLIHSAQESCQSVKQSIQEASDAHTTKFSDIGSSIDTLSQKMEEKMQQGQLSMQGSFGSLKEMVQGFSSDLSSLKIEVSKRLENMDLDVSNSVARSFNVDAQLKIMEKKVEKLSLQLSKYELPK